MIERKPLHLFGGFGVELEYMIVDATTLDARPIADEILYAVSGEYASEVERGALSWSNELILHVIELKTNGPASSLVGLANEFDRHIREINDLLAPKGARLMPTAMHPWMDPFREAKRWPHEYSPVYEAFHRLFDCRGHGWANLQSLHVNLPFTGDDEFARLHAAIRLVLPILPAIASSSPIIEGRLTGFQDYRLEVYRKNAARIPSVCGHVIPEAVFTAGEYRERLLGTIYRDIAPHDPEGILQHEWVNARGAIARFDRDSIEIRLIDVQECTQADVAITAIVTKVVEALAAGRWTSLSAQKTWAEEPLERILLETIREADGAIINDRKYLEVFGLTGRRRCTAGDLWRHLYDAVTPGLEPEDRALLGPIETILREGPLSRRILNAVGADVTRSTLAAVYRKLCDCLQEGAMFHA